MTCRQLKRMVAYSGRPERKTKSDGGGGRPQRTATVDGWGEWTDRRPRRTNGADEQTDDQGRRARRTTRLTTRVDGLGGRDRCVRRTETAVHLREQTFCWQTQIQGGRQDPRPQPRRIAGLCLADSRSGVGPRASGVVRRSVAFRFGSGRL